MKPGSLIAMVIFVVVGVLHLLRLVFQVPVTAGGVDIPVWLSAPGCIVAAGVAVLLWRESRK